MKEKNVNRLFWTLVTVGLFLGVMSTAFKMRAETCNHADEFDKCKNYRIVSWVTGISAAIVLVSIIGVTKLYK